jgi:hypothetical protein
VKTTGRTPLSEHLTVDERARLIGPSSAFIIRAVEHCNSATPVTRRVLWRVFVVVREAPRQTQECRQGPEIIGAAQSKTGNSYVIEICCQLQAQP